MADEPDGALLLDVNGVGYELRTPLGTLGRVTPAADGRVQLSTHTHVREDALELFGFASPLERQLFRLLISVPNVGPRTALGVLSSLPPEELVRAVDARDVARLTKVDGVGKKTAERLVLELRERLPRVADLAAPQAHAAPPGDEARLIGALTNMGYRPADAERAVKALGPRLGKATLGELLKEALAVLAT